MAPKFGATLIPSSPSFNNDTEAASQQLLAEASSPARRQPAAVLGANLLNAARMLPRPPALAPPVQTDKSGKLGKPGKLKRTSLFSLEDRQKKVRGARMYDLDPSPHKRSSWPAQVAPFEEEREEAQSPAADEVEDIVPESSQILPEDDLPANISGRDDLLGVEEGSADHRISENVPVSPKQARRSDASSITSKRRGRPPKRKSTEHAPPARSSDVGTAGVQDEDEPSDLSAGTKQRTRHYDDYDFAVSANQSNKAPVARKRIRLRGPKTRDPDAVEFGEDLVAPSAPVQQDARPRGDPQPEVRIPIRPTGLRTAQTEAEKAKDTSVTAIPAAASRPQERSLPGLSRTTRMKKPAPKPMKRTTNKKKASNENDSVELEEAGGGDASEVQQIAHEQPQAVENDNDDQHTAHGHEKTAENIAQDKGQDSDKARDEDADAEEAEVNALQMPIEQWRRLPEIDKVFRFKTKVAERFGVCSINVGRSIHRACDRARVTLSQSGGGPSLEDMRKCMIDITGKLERIESKVGRERRTDFKGDAYRYLFRSLVLVFEQSHHRLREKEGEVTESLVAMQILHPFVRSMVGFKDAMNSWTIKGLPRKKEENRLFKDVESYLIMPLRTVEDHFRRRLYVLENAERNRQAHPHRRSEERREPTIKSQDSDAWKGRRQRWQDLHIIRMQCEPDPARRRKLRFVEPVEAAETDANGERFERVPFFGERSLPPPQWATAASDKEWTKEQETVLLDALQSSAALEKIFRKHCGPGGALRDFSVSDITAKMTWVRSGWAQLSHQHGWEVPEWVKKIPLLP